MDKNFSGSYNLEDVNILLKPVQMDFVKIEDKERDIQANKRHYSEMLSVENLPSPEYMQLFEKAMEKNAERLAFDICVLAKIIIQNKIKRNIPEITLASLARAGTPIGVLLKKTLELLNEKVSHYSISIIRDREIDNVALRYILKYEQKLAETIFFIDGWTGKGVIGKELKKFIKEFYFSDEIKIYDELYVIADLCGEADYFATNEDYLIPSGILNAVISGLVSRSILNDKVVKENDFHACVFYQDWINEDLSNWFIDQIFEKIKKIMKDKNNLDQSMDQNKKIFERRIFDKKVFNDRLNFLNCCKARHNIVDINLIKPGIAEATRVLLRRVPELIYLYQENNVDTLHLERLAKEKSVKIIYDNNMPYLATAIIKSMNNHSMEKK